MQHLLYFVAVGCICAVAAAAARGGEEYVRAAKEIEDWIVDVRRRLHRIPELEFDLPKTSAAVRAVLDELKIQYTFPVAQSGIIATLGKGKPIVGLRADMDALPILEETGLSFQSQHEGKMHACGHDAHTAMLLGAARLLKEREPSLQGTVKLVFQPAEEIGSGAIKMMEEANLNDTDAMFGFHVWPGIKSGAIASRSGVLMASAGRFKVTVTGKGGHASSPHLIIDPHIAVANMILAYQTIISRKTSALESNVISVTTVHGGEAFNVMPETVTFSGTVRSLQAGGREWLLSQLKQMTEAIASMHGCSAEIVTDLETEIVLNNRASTEFAFDIAESLLGKDHVMEIESVMPAEDFSRFADRFPATFLFLGIEDPSVRPPSGLHTPTFTVDESVLHKGAAMHTALAIEYCERHSDSKIEL